MQGRSQGGGEGATAVGVPPQTPGRLRRKNVAGGSTLRPPLGAPASRAPPERVWARASTGSGGQAPSYILVAKEPQLPACMIKLSQPVWSAVESSNFVRSQFGAWAVRARVASPDDLRVSDPAKLDSDPPSQTGFRRIWRRSGGTTPVALLNHALL